MHRLSSVFAAFAIVLLAIVAVDSPVGAAPEDKVTICHKPGTDAEHEITVSGNALDAHLAHGDVVGPCGPPPVPCNQLTTAGGVGVTTTVHELGTAGPTSFQLTYEMFSIPDQLDVFYEGVNIYTTGTVVSGGQTVTVAVPQGSSTQVTVVVTGPDPSTAWEYTVFCPVAV